MPQHEKPLRTAIIGLSSTVKGSWAAKAHLPNLLTPNGRSRYKITALLNSSVESAASAIKSYHLPTSTKAYGDPKKLAQDADIDVVICNTRVDKHYETIYPSLLAGKDVYVEWPIAQDIPHVDLLREAARKHGSRVAVGLQRRWLPPVVKLREILDDGNGRLGKILSVDVRAYGGRKDRSAISVGLKYFAEWKVGGNPITIGVGHNLDMVMSVVGHLIPQSVVSHRYLQRPDLDVIDPETGNILETIQSNVPDLLAFTGTLKKSPKTSPGATLHYFFRAGQPFPGTPAFTFSINCEYGEILLSSPSGPTLEAAPETEPVTIKIHWYEDNSVEDVPWEWEKEEMNVEPAARGVQRCMFAFADGKKEGDGWVGIEDARELAVLIHDLGTGRN